MSLTLNKKAEVFEYPNQVSENITVSVLVQTYNQSKTIAKCINSILNQKTSFNFEIIIGEDGSTDNTFEICEKFAKENPKKIRLLKHSRENAIYINDKPTARFNFLFNLTSSKGNYVAICEGDDFWNDSCKLQKQYDFLNSNTDYSVCFHNVFKNINGEIIKSDNHQKTEFTILDLAKSNFIHTPSIFFRKNLALIPETFKTVPVGDYFLHLLNASTGKIKKLNDYMATYTISSNGIHSSKSITEKNIEWIDQLEIMKPYFSKEVQDIFNKNILSIVEKGVLDHTVDTTSKTILLNKKNELFLEEVLKEQFIIKKHKFSIWWNIKQCVKIVLGKN